MTNSVDRKLSWAVPTQGIEPPRRLHHPEPRLEDDSGRGSTYWNRPARVLREYGIVNNWKGQAGTVARVCSQDVRCSRLPYKGEAAYYPTIRPTPQEPNGSGQIGHCQTNLKSLPMAPSSARPVLFFPPSSGREEQKVS
jgi:hypothetical protein